MRETVYEALSRLRDQNPAMVNLAKGRIVGQPASVVEMAKVLDALLHVLVTMEQDIEALRAKVDAQTEGHD